MTAARKIRQVSTDRREPGRDPETKRGQPDQGDELRRPGQVERREQQRGQELGAGGHWVGVELPGREQLVAAAGDERREAASAAPRRGRRWREQEYVEGRGPAAPSPHDGRRPGRARG